MAPLYNCINRFICEKYCLMPRNEGIHFNWEKLPKVVHYQASTFNSFCLSGTYILRYKVTKSTAGHLLLQTLATWHLFCSRKILRMRITTAGHRGFGLLAPDCCAYRHRDFISSTVKMNQNEIKSCTQLNKKASLLLQVRLILRERKKCCKYYYYYYLYYYCCQCNVQKQFQSVKSRPFITLPTKIHLWRKPMW